MGRPKLPGILIISRGAGGMPLTGKGSMMEAPTRTMDSLGTQV